ncbi:MAG TPA: tungsten ABC transporter permease [Pyrodictium sp.]|nr:tungsten ABC transporter permease [Pyrodictium sp.]HIQ56227.1 tungsten ABC transporter permease [Pyrodictium sp.]
MLLYTSYGKIVRVRVTTTTSLYATGLLDYLADQFYREYPNVRIDFIAVGSGEALKRAAKGDACMVFVHAPSLEREYVEKGVLEQHRIIAYNFFVIVGPQDDPAGVRGAKSATEVFMKIYVAGEEGKATFVSRGDYSGTHVKELSIWRFASLDPRGRPWYRESGAGMAQTLVMANELRAYTLSDIGTYLKLKKDGKLPNLEILYANSTELINIYSVYIVKSCAGEERKYAELFADFIYNNQDLIGRYGVDKYGQPLFYPAKDKESDLYKIWLKLSRG